MPFDGSGNFNRVMNWVSDAAAAIKIVATRHDAEDDNFAAGLSNTLTKDGQSQPSANIPMNGKKLVNLAAPTAGTDAATKAYVDAIRTFNTAITLSGVSPQSRVGFTVADIGFGAREAGAPAGTPNRFVWNDKPDLSGTDIAIMDDAGHMALGGSAFGTNTRSSLTYPGDITFAGSGFVGFNTYWDATAATYRAAVVGWSSNMLQNQASGDILIARSAGSVAANAAQTLATLMQFSPTRGTMFFDTAFEYGTPGGSVYHQNRSTNVGYYRPNAVGNFSWTRTADGLQTGAGPVQIMSLDNAGALAVFGSITAGSTIASGGSILGLTYFASTGATAVLSAGTGSGSGGAVQLRPNGASDTTGQVQVDSTGNFYIGAMAGSTGIGCFMNTLGTLYTKKSGTGSNTHIVFNNNTGSTAVGSISTSGSATAYNTSSDERLKKNVTDYDPAAAIAMIRADPVQAFDWISDGKAAVGWIAQRSYAVSPDLATPGSGEPGDEDFAPWGIDQGKRTPYLWAALSAALDKIDALEARLGALEAA